MAFRAKATEPTPPPATGPERGSGPAKKDRATPTRREAEAARRQRLNPQLSKKEIKARSRQLQAANRQKTYREFENSPERQLMRDVVDTRFNPGEVALPVLLLLMALTFVPALQPYIFVPYYATWFFILLVMADAFLMWRRFKKEAAARIPGRPVKGLAFYGFNRQISFRRWRQPPPRLARGEKIA